MSVRILVPIRYATARLYVDKGRRWSVVEHLVLDALKGGGKTATALAVLSDLPYRIILEALINLMRVGWAEINATGATMEFVITTRGLHNVDLYELPNATVPTNRAVKFVVEQSFGSVLRWRDVNFVSQSRFARLGLSEYVALEVSPTMREVRLADIVDKVLEEDETFSELISNGARLGDGWIQTTVIGDRVEGLPPDALRGLRDLVMSAAGRTSGRSEHVRPVQAAERQAVSHDVHLGQDDIVTGGEQHRKLLENIIAKATALLIVHSTFLSERSFMTLLPQFEQAVRQRGVRVHLFWGKGDEREPDRAMIGVVDRLREVLVQRGLQHAITLHSFTTGSHAKIIVADDGHGGIMAVLGSCNWLYSDWRAFECSVRLRERPIVAEILDVLADMAFKATGDWGGIAADLSGRANELRRHPPAHRGARATAKLLLGPAHAEIISIAQDAARDRIVIGSHRLDAAAEAMVLSPLRAALKARATDVTGRTLAVTLLYSKPSGQVTPQIAASWVFASKKAGMELRQIDTPALHAKFVFWDEDDVVITSQNLLSADPMMPNAELGVHLTGTGLARILKDRLRPYFDTERTFAIPAED